MIKSGIERLKILEFPWYIFDTGKNTKIRTYYVGHSVPAPDFSKPIRTRSVPAPKILKLIRTRTRTRTKFSKKIRTRHVYAAKNQIFSWPRRRRIVSTHSGPWVLSNLFTQLVISIILCKTIFLKGHLSVGATGNPIWWLWPIQSQQYVHHFSTELEYRKLLFSPFPHFHY